MLVNGVLAGQTRLDCATCWLIGSHMSDEADGKIFDHNGGAGGLGTGVPGSARRLSVRG